MARLVWSVSDSNIAISGASDLWECNNFGTGYVWQLHQIWVSQRSEAGDAQAEQLTVTVRRRTGAISAGAGSGRTPVGLVSGLAWPAGIDTFILSNASGSSGGTLEPPYAVRSFDVRDGIDISWPPWRRPTFPLDSSSMLLVSISAPADEITFDFGMVFSTGVLPT